MQRTVGVLIGRFQLPTLHKGHEAIIDHVMRENDEICVLVGITARADMKNLLPYAAVEQMIRERYIASYSVGRLHILPLRDAPGEDLQWSMQIDRLLDFVYPDHCIRLYSGRDSFKPHYHGKFMPVIDWYGFNGEINGTKAREAIMNAPPRKSEDFRAGIIYGLGNYLRGKE